MGEAADRRGTPIGRRVVLGMVGLGAAGVVVGSGVANGLASALKSFGTGGGIVPGADVFQIYTVVDGYPQTPPDYHLVVDGLVEKPLSLTVADLQAMPATNLVKPFQCVTGWRVPDVHWRGVKLSELLQEAKMTAGAKALHFESFDGVYTESLTLDQAKLPDVIVAYEMLGAPVSREHGGPVRMYVTPMYGYKSIKWLSRISVVDRVEPGYWENYGCAVNGWVGASNGYHGPGIS